MLIFFGVILLILAFMCFYIPIEDHLIYNHSKSFVKKHTKGFFKKVFLLDFLKEVNILWFIPYMVNWLIFLISIPLQILLWLNPNFENNKFMNLFVGFEIFLLGLDFLLKIVFLPLLFQIKEDIKNNKKINVILLSCCFLVLFIFLVIKLSK